MVVYFLSRARDFFLQPEMEEEGVVEVGIGFGRLVIKKTYFNEFERERCCVG